MEKLHPVAASLLQDIDAFCEASGMTVTRFGKEAVNDPAFVASLKSGRDLRLTTIDRVRAFMDTHVEHS